MALVINELFNGPSGVALSTANTSATLYSGAGSSVFDTATATAEGSASAQFTTSAALRQAQWGLTSATQGFFSFYITPTAVPSANTSLLILGTTSTDTVCVVVFMTTGMMKLGNSGYVTQGTVTTTSLVNNQLNRIDLSYTAGTLKMEVYPGNALAGSAVGTATAGNTRTGTTTVTNYAWRSLGHGLSSTFTSRFDAFREDSTALPGPAVTAPPTPLAGAVTETDALAAVLVSPTALAGALAETDTVGAALSVTSTPLTATLALVPSSGVIPFTVTATCTATGGGATKSYAWTWGDGTTTAAGPSNVATHLVTSSGIYTTSCTVT